jgi:hypothetical protein
MEPVIVTSQPPKTTLSLDTVVYIGQNQIRRCVSRNTTLYSGERVVDQTLTLAPDAVYNVEQLNLAIGAVAVFTDTPILVTLDDSTLMPIKRMLVFDSNDLGKLTLTNTSITSATVRLTYLM